MSRVAIRSVLVRPRVAGIGYPALARPVDESLGSARSIRDFNKVEIGIGGVESLEIAASAEEVSRNSTVVRMGALRIGLGRPSDSPRGRVTCRLTMKDISSLQTTSSSGKMVRLD